MQGDADRIIRDELTLGRVDERSRATYTNIIERLRDSGSEALVLACTEIELLVRPEDSPSRQRSASTHLERTPTSTVPRGRQQRFTARGQIPDVA